ncbi:MAG TPA: serine hydrolase [Ktedonobacteraceae bacterium]
MTSKKKHAQKNAIGTGRLIASLKFMTLLLALSLLSSAYAFPNLFLPGKAAWVENQHRDHVQQSSPKRASITNRILSSNATTSTSAWASFEILSPHLAHYLATLKSNIGVSVHDLSRQRSYSYNASQRFIAASSIKVPIMLAFLDKLERQKREPNTREIHLLATMIKYSNNDSASILYDKIGGASGLTSFLRKHGIRGLAANPGAWGYSRISPQTMVDLLTRLATGRILTRHHRALALNLMRHVQASQRFGVGDTAPRGASVALKNGWVIAPDRLWAINSSGIITVHRETYVIAVYTKAQSSLKAGQRIIRSVCKKISALLA